MNGPIDPRAIGAVLQQAPPRERSYLLAQVLQQMNQPRPNPQSYGSLAAQLGAQALDKGTADREAQAMQQQQQGQAQQLAQALQGYQQQSKGGMTSLPGTGVQLDTLPDPEGARSTLMGSLVQNQNPMAQGLAQQLMGQMMAPPPEPEYKDLGGSLGEFVGGKPTGKSIPKTATPDATMREQGDDRRHGESLTATNERFLAGERNEFARLNMRLQADQANVGSMNQKEIIKETSGLRKEFNGLAEVQDFKKVLPLLSDLQTAPDTPAGDLSYTYGIAQISDPASAVKEGEQTLVLNAASPLAKIFGATRVNFGKARLSPAQRQQLLAIAENKVSKLQTAYDTTRNQYSMLAGKMEADPLDVVGEHFGEAFEAKNSPKSGAAQSGVRKYNPQTGKIE